MLKHIKKTSAIAVVWMMFIGCIIADKNDIYKAIPVGSRLSKNVLPRFQQFYKNGSGVVVVYDVSDNAEYYNPHLLFYDSTLTMYAACYFPAEQIDSIKNNVIYADLNHSRAARRNSFRNDLPKTYQLRFTEKPNGRGANFDKVADSVAFTASSIKIYISKTLNNEQLRDGHSYADLGTQQPPPLKDTVKIPLNTLNIYRKGNRVMVLNNRVGGHPMWDKISINDDTVWHNFYEGLWKFLTS